MEEAHTNNVFLRVKAGQNIISPDPKLVESQLMTQTIHNDQVYISSRRNSGIYSVKTNKNDKI